MQTQTRDDLHAQYLQARKPYEPMAQFVNSDRGPGVWDVMLIAFFCSVVGLLLFRAFGLQLVWGMMLGAICLALFHLVAKWRDWKVMSFRRWYMQRFEPIRAQHESAFRGLLAHCVLPETLDSWKLELLKGRAACQLAGYEIVFDAKGNYFRVMGAQGFLLGDFREYGKIIGLLKSLVRQAGLCSE